MDSLVIKAKLDKLPELMSYVKNICLINHANAEQLMAIELAVEEIVVNIMNYAYPENCPGNIELSWKYRKQKTLVITISDNGRAYNPLTKSDPDTNASIKQRPIGGLGIFLFKEMVDNFYYENKHGKNILTLEKSLKAND